MFRITLRPLISTLFPYTTLFRSRKPLGFSFGARALAGPARSIEDEQVHTSLQVTGGVGIGYRTLQRDVGFAINYGDRKSTRLNSSHLVISYAVFCLKKKEREEGE